MTTNEIDNFFKSYEKNLPVRWQFGEDSLDLRYMKAGFVGARKIIGDPLEIETFTIELVPVKEKIESFYTGMLAAMMSGTNKGLLKDSTPLFIGPKGGYFQIIGFNTNPAGVLIITLGDYPEDLY